MNMRERDSVLAIAAAVLAGAGMAFAGSHGSIRVNGLPLFALLVAFAFVIQWLAFIPAFFLRTEKFFDITGSMTYITVMVIAVAVSLDLDGRSILLLVLVLIWAVRLGSFLIHRIHAAGKDVRFDEIKPSFFRFLLTWTLQGLWVTFTAAAALVAITTTTRKTLGPYAAIGLLVWLFGFSIEVVADTQKRRFRASPENRGKFINTGLWARSRHPNYFGEIVLWIGVAIIALPVLRGWQFAALASPIFVMLLLTRVSGVPVLEQRADSRWGGSDDFEAYKTRTPVLIPRLTRHVPTER